MIKSNWDKSFLLTLAEFILSNYFKEDTNISKYNEMALIGLITCVLDPRMADKFPSTSFIPDSVREAVLSLVTLANSVNAYLSTKHTLHEAYGIEFVKYLDMEYVNEN